MRFTKTLSKIVHGAAAALAATGVLDSQVPGGLVNLVPPQAWPFVALGLAAMQGIAALKAHSTNPDGTPATEPWTPPRPPRP